jgi:hypothetical protein
MDELKSIINAIAELAPGPGDQWFTASQTMLAALKLPPSMQRISLRDLDKLIAERVGIEVGSGAFDACIIRYDENGNPQFQLSKEAARSRTRKDIRKLVEYELRTVFIWEEEQDRITRVTDRIMAVIEREGR